MNYAIIFDIDTDALKQAYHNESRWQDAYINIRTSLESNGFKFQNGLYLGDKTINPVHCVLAVQSLSQSFPWFQACVRNIKMLRITDINDMAKCL